MTSAVALLLVALATNEEGYVRSRALPNGASFDPKAHCLWWKPGTVPYHLQQDGNPETRGNTELTAIADAFSAWQAVFTECGSLRFEQAALIADRTVGFIETDRSRNTNSIVFRTRNCQDVVGVSDSCWREGTCQNRYDCWAYSRPTLALTSTTFDPKTGEIFDADIELNAEAYIFTTVDSPKCVSPSFHQGCVASDVQNVMTHEIGHMIGLDHISQQFCKTPGVTVADCAPSELTASTMTASAVDGETYKRFVDPGSQSFVCSAYPKGQLSARDCVINPLDSILGPKAGCSASSGLLPFAALLTALTARRRRRGGAEGRG